MKISSFLNRARTRLTPLLRRLRTRSGLTQIAILAGVAGAALALMLCAYLFLIVLPGLPALDALIDYQPKIPLRIYTADQMLIGEFGEEHRRFTKINEIPLLMRQAVVAIEDDRFYQHHGVDFRGIARAAWSNLRGTSVQGGSTITMQVARNFFLTRKKTVARKMSEVMLAYKIEEQLSKDQILELYMNQIYLGQRAYGFAHAAEAYFGKSLDQLSLAQIAVLAGLPQAPANANPVVSPARALRRQKLVLKRMRDLGIISAEQQRSASVEPIRAISSGLQFRTHAEYAAELARQAVVQQFGDDAYTRGLSVYTTLLQSDQDAAYEAVRRGVLDYDRRHGYRGPEAILELPDDDAQRHQFIADALSKRASSSLRPAVVLTMTPRQVRAELISGEILELTGDALRFAMPALQTNARAALKIKPGAVIRVEQNSKGKWAIVQLPQVAAALVGLNPQTGAYRALVGGFDFDLNKFEHVSQAWRQPGSAIKPFVYSAALEKGFSPGTLIDDAPYVAAAGDDGGPGWEPKNDDDRYDGPITMRTALAQSKNVVAVRILKAITPQFAQGFLAHFGFEPARHPANLTLTLGSGAVTPLQMVSAYAVFANGGYQIKPYLIQKIVDARGNLLAEQSASVALTESSRVLDPRNAYLMDTMLREVVRSGTAAAAQKLNRADLAGKTGTTSDAVDGWFAGYGGGVVAVAWMGYDDPKSLGAREFGATLALPIWTHYMHSALQGRAEVNRPTPAGLTQVNGEWMYDEYLNGGGVPALEVEKTGIGGLIDRIFGGGSTPSPSVPAPPTTPVPAAPTDPGRTGRDYMYGG